MLHITLTTEHRAHLSFTLFHYTEPTLRARPGTMADAAEWETSKENVMPLKHGRNVTKLNAALAEK